jgi:hypothetical protein
MREGVDEATVEPCHRAGSATAGTAWGARDPPAPSREGGATAAARCVGEAGARDLSGRAALLVKEQRMGMGRNEWRKKEKGRRKKRKGGKKKRGEKMKRK